MIHFVKGNIFESDADALVNAVNTVGVMGGGIALEFKNRYPNNFSVYKQACDKGELKTGDILVVKENDGKTIINFPTKEHWKNPSQYEYIASGLIGLKEKIKEHNIRSIALPALGCGLGGLMWDKVKSMIESELKNVDADIYVYEPKTNK